MNISKNAIFLIGNLGQDPKRGITQAGETVAKFSLATSEKARNSETGVFEKIAVWHRVVAFGKLADTILGRLKKGELVHVLGRSKTHKYQDGQGVDHWRTEVIAREVNFLSMPANHQAATAMDRHRDAN